MANRQDELKKALVLSKILRWGVPIGLLLMLASCFEQSLPWAAFVCVTGWCGLAAGYSGGPGLADYVLHRLPEQHRPSAARFNLVGLLTFWGPTLSIPVVGALLMHAMKDEYSPAQKFFLLTTTQTLAMYFTWAGAAWAVVHREITRDGIADSPQ